MAKHTRRNILITPVVLLIRAPLMLGLYYLMVISKFIYRRADRVQDWVHRHIPGWER